MKTLKDHTIIYDNECPLCNVYTGAFVKSRMLDQQGRQPYNNLEKDLECVIDKDRARNEIALIDKSNNHVIYGIESLFKVIGYNMPVFKPLFRFKPFRFAMKHLYAFISYNRKVIIPGNAINTVNTCVPDFNAVYRWAYLIAAWLITSLILTKYVALIPQIPKTSFLREYVICGGQLLFQALVYYLIKRDKGIVEYLGNLMTISLAGSLALLPVLWVNHLIHPAIPGVYFMVVVTLMLVEHVRRVRLISALPLMTITWVLYRIIVLLIVLNIAL